MAWGLPTHGRDPARSLEGGARQTGQETGWCVVKTQQASGQTVSGDGRESPFQKPQVITSQEIQALARLLGILEVNAGCGER